jgi:hypothetical protein
MSVAMLQATDTVFMTSLLLAVLPSVLVASKYSALTQ